MAAGDTDTTFISAAVIYKLLKQFYCDAGCFPNNLTQSVYESVFQSVPRFSHVRVLTFLAKNFKEDNKTKQLLEATLSLAPVETSPCSYQST